MNTIKPNYKAIEASWINGMQFSCDEYGELCKKTVAGCSESLITLIRVSAKSIVSLTRSGLIKCVANKHEHDLCQEAFMGVVAAAKAYRSEKNVLFHTMSKLYIKRTMYDFARENYSMIKMPYNQDFIKVCSQFSQLHDMGIDTPEKAAEYLDMEFEGVKRAFDYKSNLFIDSEDDFQEKGFELDDKFRSPVNTVMDGYSRSEKFENICRVLTDSEKSIVEHMILSSNMTEAAAALNLSVSAIRYQYSIAKDKIMVAANG